MGNVEQAWAGLPPELKGVMMGIIMGNSLGSRNNNHAPQMPQLVPPMMVMNPMMQGMEMGGYGIQGMSGMMAGANPQMNGGHNPGLNNQHNEGASRDWCATISIKPTVATFLAAQDPGGASEQTEDLSALYGDDMDPQEQHHHEQQRMQDQMRHMQHMNHMGMGAGFMPGMDLAAMFGNA
ncbi:cleavage polyadenylation factor subunit fip1 [Puccinia graminis f. sp. tritici]|uniref:Cleavage polyadenylation factor subunit fip1 n=1 Tax=Puccinia graminis f. sp. tritici TaxID=56615 RepID=A0A5B0P415_PUCGR|nr:cleavage polyadenylation factor subunit fip1 [Puccinia graminis f. sp. tritici]